MEIKSTAKFIRVSPDKLRILTSMLKNKSYNFGMDQLQVSTKDAAKPLINLLKQAKDSIKDQNINEESLFIKEIRIDEGPKLKRRRILHQGRATQILKRMSHATIVLTDNGSQKSKVKSQKEETKKEKNGTQS